MALLDHSLKFNIKRMQVMSNFKQYQGKQAFTKILKFDFRDNFELKS